jgi:phosphoglycolate phosphatase-like HAD superfamily hydrolase
MLEAIGGGEADEEELGAEIDRYIDESTGIQTASQMAWMRDMAKRRGRKAKDVWEYKDEYNRRLLEAIDGRLSALRSGAAKPEDFMVGGARAFLEALAERGARLYLASGTDQRDVLGEARLLGVDGFFKEIRGALDRSVSCSKEALMREILADGVEKGESLAVIGDGKVEIMLAFEVGAYPLGIASDEVLRHGVNPVKRSRLAKAGAAAVAGDFLDKDALLGLLGL